MDGPDKLGSSFCDKQFPGVLEGGVSREVVSFAPAVNLVHCRVALTYLCAESFVRTFVVGGMRGRCGKEGMGALW